MLFRLLLVALALAGSGGPPFALPAEAYDELRGMPVSWVASACGTLSQGYHAPQPHEAALGPQHASWLLAECPGRDPVAPVASFCSR